MKWVSQGEGFVPHFLPLEEKPSSIYSFLKETLLRWNATKLCQTATEHVWNVSRAETRVMRLHYLASAAKHCINWFSFKAPSMSFPPQQPNNFQEQRIPHNPSPRRWHSKLPSPNNWGKRWGKTSCARTTKSKNWVTLHRTRRRSTQFCVREHIRKSDITYSFFLHHRLSIVRILSNQKQHPRQIPYAP